MKKLILVLTLILAGLLLFGCTQPNNGPVNGFKEIDGSICKQDNKPIIRMYSTSFCPHCQWVKPAFSEVAKSYMDENKIVAHVWEWIYDSQGNQIGADDSLTPQNEGSVPDAEKKVFDQFNPNGTIPTFVFGCKYYRIGNQFEAQKDLNAEKVVFTQIIEELLKGN
jgi:thiol-disulfide isomerase/thioredoxin